MNPNPCGQLSFIKAIFLLSASFLLLLLNWERPLFAMISMTALLWVLLLKKRSLAGLFIILSVTILFYRGFIDNIITILETPTSIYENKRKILQEILQPNSGIDSLPPQYMPAEVKKLREMVNSNQLPNFNLLGQLREDPLKLQRAIEVNWPVKLEIDSKYQFYLGEDAERLDSINACQKIDQKEEVVLVVCP